MSQVVRIPNWVRKTPIIGRFMTPISAAGGLSQNDKDIILKIVKQFKDQSRKEMDNWRTALDAINDPNNPRWYLYQDLLDYLEPDSQLGTAKDIRAAATLGKAFMVYDKKTGKEIPEKTLILKDKQWFFNFCWNMLDTVLRGYTVAQLIDPVKMEFSYIPRRNFIPQKDMVVFEVDGNVGINIKEPPFDKTVICVKYKHEKGILNDIICNLIWKKNSRESWAEFSEKFGIPLVTAETNKTNTKDLDKLEFMLKSLGEAATAVFPTGTKITIHDAPTKGDPYNVYLKQIELDDEAIVKRMLGGTMLTDNGSSKSQSEVHERMLGMLTLFDTRLITFVVNDILFPMMPQFGENDGFKFDDSEKVAMPELWKIVKEMLESGFQLETGWVRDKFDVPITDYTPVVKGTANPNGNFNTATGNLAAMLVAKNVTLPVYKARCCNYHAPAAADSFTENLLSTLSDELINLVWEGKDTLINEVLKSIAGYKSLLNALLDSWSERMLNISYDSTDVHCLAAMEYNIFSFSRMKEKANVLALNELKGKASTFNEFVDLAQPYLKNADVNWMRTEWNHTFAVGQNASRYHQFFSEKDTLTRYVQWQTVGDSRVRPAHQVMDNKIFDLNDPSGLTIWPPKDWGCRCEMVQYLGNPHPDLLLSNEEGLKILQLQKGDQWAVNRGRIEQVFTANEMYLKEQGIAQEINKLTYSDYKLPAYDDIKDGYSSLSLDNSITKNNVQELFKPEKDKSYMGFEDYQGRKMILKKKVFDEHVSTEKYLKQNRHQLFAKIADVLADPDEVYYFKYNKGNYQTRYVKFYNDGAIVVPTNLGSNNVEINSWYNMDNEANTRRGYLIHKKGRK